MSEKEIDQDILDQFPSETELPESGTSDLLSGEIEVEGHEAMKELEEKVKYDRFMENERPEKEEDYHIDEEGRKFQYWDIGMTRNAKPENKKRMKVYLHPAPHVILDQDVKTRGWYKSKFEKKGVRPRPCYTDALLTQPYGGACPVKCAMCYINNGVRGYRGQGITVVDPHYPEKIKKQLDRARFAFPAYISSFTESFQKLEDVFHNTQRLSKVVTDFGLPLFYLTRKIPPEWADDFLLMNPHSYMQYSIVTSNRADNRKIAPGAATIDEMLENIRKQTEKGIYHSIQVNPILSGITSNDEVVKLLEELAQAGADHVIFKFVEIVSPAVPAMKAKLRRFFPDRADAFDALFTETIGGMRTIQEEHRIESLNLFSEATKKFGLTMGTCYEYEYERDEDGKIVDKTGVNLAPKYLTADQCHGKRTPLYIKDTDGLFKAFDGCPPSGCLHCADVNPDGPPCGVDYLYRAPALKPSDYNKAHWGDQTVAEINAGCASCGVATTCGSSK